MINTILPYALSFTGSLILTLILTPLVREFNRAHGLVDKPDPRRINKVPIPRGGGVAVVFGTLVPYIILCFATDLLQEPLSGISCGQFILLGLFGVLIAAIGYVDDKYSLPPKVKLLGQVVVAFLTWAFGGIGFAKLWPSLPWILDCFLTMIWIVGAVNAFNLIDGLDGLASGLALIATMGMAGSLLFWGKAGSAPFYFAFAGALLGFLRYNYNPASVFLGDSGSMFIGYTLAALPLCSHVENSFLVSVGVPLLAMGVPIFDTSLAIIRRSIRRLLNKGEIMTADKDHLHHRILISVGLSQRKAAWSLYALAMALVAVGLVGVTLKSRAAGLWIGALTVFSVIIFKDMARIELFDAGRLLDSVAHDKELKYRRFFGRLAVPYYITMDILAYTVVFIGTCTVANLEVNRALMTTLFPIHLLATLVFFLIFRIYRTIWSRAVLSNYLRLAIATIFGSVVGLVSAYYISGNELRVIAHFTTTFTLTFYLAIITVRIIRNVIRDMFYLVSSLRMMGRKDVSRILVYGTGLKFRAFRREKVRHASKTSRIIVGLLDDDIFLRNHYIGGLKVCGTLAEAPAIINKLNVDAVVIACDVSDEWLEVVKKTLKPTGVRVTRFTFNESEL